MFRTEYARFVTPTAPAGAARPQRVWVKVDGKLECRWVATETVGAQKAA